MKRFKVQFGYPYGICLIGSYLTFSESEKEAKEKCLTHLRDGKNDRIRDYFSFYSKETLKRKNVNDVYITVEEIPEKDFNDERDNRKVEVI